jgi:hypothetical protein
VTAMLGLPLGLNKYMAYPALRIYLVRSSISFAISRAFSQLILYFKHKRYSRLGRGVFQDII